MFSQLVVLAKNSRLAKNVPYFCKREAPDKCASRVAGEIVQHDRDALWFEKVNLGSSASSRMQDAKLFAARLPVT